MARGYPRPVMAARVGPVSMAMSVAMSVVISVVTPLLTVGCSAPERQSAPVESRESRESRELRDRQTGPGSSPAANAATPISTDGTVDRAASRWVQVPWSELPGLAGDRPGQAMAALSATCMRPTIAWREACAAAALLNPQDDAAVRAWMKQHLQPWRIEDRSGARDGLLTGYYEPHFQARRSADREFKAALHAPPADLQQRRPYWSRQQLDTLREAQAALRGRALAYLRDPVDVLVLQIQGSGRLTITEPDGSQRTVRLSFAGHNDHPYGSVGRWLIEQGQLSPAQASWPGIRDWMQRNPRRVQEAMWANPRVVFFREEPLNDPQQGPRGAMGVPLTPERSIAVDPRSIPYGTPLWLSAAEPSGANPLQRLVVAQDTGSAITGGVRADYFWGWGERAEQMAGRMRHRLAMWALWPVGHRPPS